MHRVVCYQQLFLVEIIDFKNPMTSKTGLEVHQGHWEYHHSTEHILLPIDVLE